MKKSICIVLLFMIVLNVFTSLNVSAADGELLVAVNWLNDPLKTVNMGATACQDFNEKFDLSKSTEDLLFLINQNCSDAVWDSDMFYIEDSGYYITNDTKFTVYFEVATPHGSRYSGVPFLHDTSKYGGYIMLMGCFSDNGDTKSNGGKWTEFAYSIDYANRGSILGEGYDDLETVMLCHPALKSEALGAKDTCSNKAVVTFKFSTIKIEIDGLSVTTWYLDADKNWQRADSFGREVRYTAEFGSEIVLGTYCRNQNRHNIMRNVKLLQGVGLSYDQVWSAKQTTEPKPAKPALPETTEDPLFQTSEDTGGNYEPEVTTTSQNSNKGCSSSVAFLPVVALTAACLLAIRKKRK